MKRQIKFRVFDDRLKKFNYFDLTNVTGNLPSDCLDNVQQFAGLLDVNGVEIYEGDIIKYEGTSLEYPFIGQVKFGNCSFYAIEDDSVRITLGVGLKLEVVSNISKLQNY